jgi:ornithine carbamoyltransferase
MTRHLLDLDQVGSKGIAEILALCEPARGQDLASLSAALVFEKPSARTRNATEMAVVDLGGHAIVINDAEVGIDRRETAEDVARTLGCYHQIVAARVHDHHVLERMAGALDADEADVSVINLLSDHSHPCQGLADALTMRQVFDGEVAGRRVAYIGDANNVTISLVQVSLALGMDVIVAAPERYQLSGEVVAELATFGLLSGATLRTTADPREAAEGASVLYTDVWTSMGQEAEREKRLQDLAGYSIDTALCALASDDAVVLHCLPAHRGEEIAAEVLEGPRSKIWLQAAHRRTAMRGVFRWVRSTLP